MDYLFSKILLQSTLYLLIVSYVFDPTGELFHLKYISTLIAMIVLGVNMILPVKKENLSKIQLVFILLFCLFIPIYGLSITFLQSSNHTIIDTSYLGFSLSLVFLIPVLCLNENKFYNSFIQSLRILKLFILVILLSFLVNGDQLGIAQFFIDHNSMFVGYREYGGISTYYLYFAASPLLIFLLTHDCIYLLKKYSPSRFLLFVLSAVAIFLTGTRFNMLFAILILPFSIIVRGFSLRYLGSYFIFFLILLILLLESQFLRSFFDSSEISNAAKTSYFDYYLDILSDPKVILFGQGFNATEWSIPFMNMLLGSNNSGVKTELTYIETIRVFGVLFGTLINFTILITPILMFMKYKEINAKVLGVFFYILSSMLNPYVFSTNGVLVFLLILTSIPKKIVVSNFTLIRSHA
jgi:hypothetical protein